MSLDADLRAKVLSVVGANVPVQHSYADMDTAQTRVWFQKRSDTNDLFASGVDTTIRDVTYEVEVNAVDPAAGEAIAAVLLSNAPVGMNGFIGLMGSTRVLGCWASNASDDFQFRGLDLDDGYHGFGLELRFLL